MNRHDEPRHPIRVVAQRTGLTPATLRAWERRYGVVDPDRSGGGQRLYSDADVERLNRMRMLTEAGRAISMVAELSDEQARDLLTEDREAAVPAPGQDAVPLAVDPGELVAEAFEHVRSMDGPGLEGVLRRSAVVLGAVPFLEQVVAPLFHKIGNAWVRGALGPAEEHLASGIVERVLAWLTDPVQPPVGAPAIVVATLPGERHGLGTKLVSTAAALEGWRVVYLGIDLPVDEIAEGATRVDARVVALSVVNADLLHDVAEALRRLRAVLPEETRLLVGGAAAGSLSDASFSPGVTRLSGLSDLRRVLTER